MAKQYPKWMALAPIVVGGAIFNTSVAYADGGSEPQCVTQPATVTVVETTNSSSTSITHIHVEVKKTVDEQVRQFEKAHNVIIAIRQKSKGVKSSKHCKDPVKLGWIKPGQPFTNTRHDKSPFTAPWQNGRKICNFKIIHRGGKTIAKGDKDDCGNTGIEIVIHGQKPKPQTQQIIEFKTKREFQEVYDKWIAATNNSSSTSTGTFSMLYSCAPGWSLIEDSWGNHMCRKCEQKPPPPPPPNTPPVVTAVTQPQEVYVYDVDHREVYRNFTAKVSAPAGDSVKVTVTAMFGIGYTQTVTSVGGTATVVGDYLAPTDLPYVWAPPDWSGLHGSPDTWEQVHVTAVDLTTGLSTATAGNPPPDRPAYVWFVVRKPSPTCC